MKVVKDEIVVTVYSCIPEGEVPMEAWPQSPSELTLPFFGADARRFSGAYGTRGRELCGHLATQWATKRRMRCFPLDVALTIDGAHSTRAMITRSHLDAGHSWLHFERIASALREEIKEKFIICGIVNK